MVQIRDRRVRNMTAKMTLKMIYRVRPVWTHVDIVCS